MALGLELETSAYGAFICLGELTESTQLLRHLNTVWETFLNIVCEHFPHERSTNWQNSD